MRFTRSGRQKRRVDRAYFTPQVVNWNEVVPADTEYGRAVQREAKAVLTDIRASVETQIWGHSPPGYVHAVNSDNVVIGKTVGFFIHDDDAYRPVHYLTPQAAAIHRSAEESLGRKIDEWNSRPIWDISEN